ncbi:MAG: hypothetical protein AAGE84_28650 [Cyanobacteria bacterium P01_G01_bin.39]
MPKSKQVFSTGQQSKLQQLQLEVAALEEQLANTLQKQTEVTARDNSQIPTPLIQVNARTAQTGIRLAHDLSN